MSSRDDLSDRMMLLQRRIVDSGARVLLIFEGRSGRVIGRVANEFMNLVEPRQTTYTHFIPESGSGERLKIDYLVNEPSDGKIAIYDRSWYSDIIFRHINDEGTDEAVRNAISLERYLSNNGTVIVKIFLDVKSEVLPKATSRFGCDRAATNTFLTDDRISQKDFDRRFFKSIMDLTDAPHSPWDVIEADEIETTVGEVVERFLDRVRTRLDDPFPAYEARVEEMFPNPRRTADLTLKAVDYDDQLKKLSGRLGCLQNRLAATSRSLVLLFEGWDAAGKGGTIKRVTRALNPRGYSAFPVAAPTATEKSHTYLWRFADQMPECGHIVIFDRSWYGRMMVEPIEGFCTEEEYNRSAGEIREFERMIERSGCILIKFWMEISKDEQLARFESRQQNPVKSWKITEEDWRNRGKWDVYEQYIDRMISSTNTSYAPWNVIESEDKRHGRLKVLRIIIDTLTRELN